MLCDSVGECENEVGSPLCRGSKDFYNSNGILHRMAGIQIPYERILETIQQKTNLSAQEIESKINAKLKQLSGLISKQGAAHIVANELGVKLIEQVSGKLKVNNIMGGMRDVETEGRVVRVFEVREFKTERASGRVGSFIVGDESGTIRVVLWNDQTEKLSQLQENGTVRIVGAYTRASKDQNGKDRIEIHLNDRSKLILNPPGVSVAEVKQKEFTRKKIRDIVPEDNQVEVLGTIYQVFDPRFFEVCPECNRRVRAQNDVYNCETHGQVTPTYSFVLNLFLDDGTSTIRLVCFREQALRLLEKEKDEFLTYRTSPETFENVKTELLGQIIKVVGRVTKNDMFDRLELIAQLVYPNPNPEEELARMEQANGEAPAQETAATTPTEPAAQPEPETSPQEPETVQEEPKDEPINPDAL